MIINGFTKSVRNHNTGYSRVDHLYLLYVSQSPTQEDDKRHRLVPNKGRSLMLTKMLSFIKR